MADLHTSILKLQFLPYMLVILLCYS